MLELYQIENCSYCAKVRKKLMELQLDYIIRNEPAQGWKRERLKKVAGQTIVPVLVDSEKSIVMPESSDIVEYLERTYGNKK